MGAANMKQQGLAGGFVVLCALLWACLQGGAGVAQIVGDQKTFSPGEPIFLRYAGVDPTWERRAAAAIFAADAPSGPFGDTYLGHVSGSGHALFPISGVVQLEAPLEPGDYEIRVFLETKHESLPTAEYPFKVTLIQTFDLLGLSGPASPHPGDVIGVEYWAPAYADQGRIALYGPLPSDVPSQRLEELRPVDVCRVGEARSGEMLFSLPAEPGTYQFHLYLGDAEEGSAAESIQFSSTYDGAIRLLDSPPLPEPGFEARTTDRSGYVPGQAMLVEYQISGEHHARIHVFPADERTRKRLEEDGSIGSLRIYGDRGVIQIDAPDWPGSYELRLYSTSSTVDDPLDVIPFEVLYPSWITLHRYREVTQDEPPTAHPVYYPGDEILVFFSFPASWDPAGFHGSDYANWNPDSFDRKAYLGIVPAQPGNLDQSFRTDQFEHASTGNFTSGQAVLMAPETLGTYWVALFSSGAYDGQHCIITSYVPFGVTARSTALRGASPLRPIQPTLAVDRGTPYHPQDWIYVAFGVPAQLGGAQWIGLFSADTRAGLSSSRSDGRHVQRQMAYGELSGTLAFRAPDLPGNYEFRLFAAGDSARAELARVPISVIIDTTGRDKLHLSRSEYTSGEIIELEFAAHSSYLSTPTSSAAGVVLLRAGDAEAGVRYGEAAVSAIADQSLSGLLSGTLRFTAPSETGDYVFRMYERRTQDGCQVDSLPVTVTDSTQMGTLTPAKQTFLPQESLAVDFTASAAYADALDIALFRAGTALPGVSFGEMYPQMLIYKRIERRTRGRMTFDGLVEPGEYEFRMYHARSGYEIARATVSVAIDAEAASLSLDAPAYTPGQVMNVRFTASPSYLDDAWVAILRAGEVPVGAHGNEADWHDISYQFLGKDRVEGILLLYAPTEPGSFDVRMYDRGTGTEYEVARTTFSVVAPEGDSP